jgi:hypothetical protein
MEMMLYLYYVFALVYLFLIPAAMIGKTLYPRHQRAARIAIGMALHAAIMPTAAFALAMILQTNVSITMLYALATVIIAGGMAVQLIRLRRRTQALEE